MVNFINLSIPTKPSVVYVHRTNLHLKAYCSWIVDFGIKLNTHQAKYKLVISRSYCWTQEYAPVVGLLFTREYYGSFSFLGGWIPADEQRESPPCPPRWLYHGDWGVSVRFTRGSPPDPRLPQQHHSSAHPYASGPCSGTPTLSPIRRRGHTWCTTPTDLSTATRPPTPAAERWSYVSRRCHRGHLSSCRDHRCCRSSRARGASQCRSNGGRHHALPPGGSHQRISSGIRGWSCLQSSSRLPTKYTTELLPTLNTTGMRRSFG